MDASVIGPAAAGNRHFSGTLTGCKLEEDKLQEVGHCSTVSAQKLVATFWANPARLAEQGNPTEPHSDPRCRRAKVSI